MVPGLYAPTAGENTIPFTPTVINAINPSNLSVINRLGIVIACESGTSADQYVVTVSNLRVDYRL